MDQFKEHKIFTNTNIIWTNAQLDLHKLFNFLPITKLKILEPREKKRKQCDKKKERIQDLKWGDIISLKYKGKLRGELLKPPKAKSKAKSVSYFKNSVCVDIMLSKLINFKISTNGKFQVTGCEGVHHAKRLIKHIFNLIQGQDIYTLPDDSKILRTYIQPVLFNISFSFENLTIDRSKLHDICDEETDFISIYYANEEELGHIQTLKYIYEELPKLTYPVLEYSEEKWSETSIGNSKFIQTVMNDKQRARELKKRFCISLMPHRGGNVIMSGFGLTQMEHVYREFHKMINKHRKRIEIKCKTY